ncbi:MAG: T9SS type A sorting domain-containing protein, partial [Bacteroidia bacterium]|nr:T9SS type A sorting domain-containing protein [Bacteroidia bacterium]
QGQFVADGTEKYAFVGNFRHDSITNSQLSNPTHLPANFSDYLIDDVSLIESDLYAFAGNDTMIFVGDSIFLGRQPDIGINEACLWYKLPNMTIPIDTIAGFWIKPTSTETYIVKQEICGNVKWDTVIVKPVLYTGNSLFDFAHSDIRVFPNPADRFLELKISGLDLKTHFDKISIYNSLGQIVTTEEVKTKIGTESLPEGVYLLELRGNSGTVSKRFVIAR